MRNQRKQVWIDAEAQRRLVWQMSWPWMVSMVAAIGVISFLAFRFMNEALAADLYLPTLAPLLIGFSVFTVVSTFLSLYWWVRVSHRIAGPSYRIRQTLKAVMEGRGETRAHLRRGDFLDEIAQDVNAFLDWSKHRAPPEGSSPVAEELSEAEEEPAVCV